ncbi:MAG: hypothetical protein KC996_05895 [Phycisphaerales bacterium]|nr:hypothetical protein [Phycisphaerales bacterium]
MSSKGFHLFGAARTVVLVTIIAVLLWLMAESQMVQSRTIEVQIVLVSPAAAEGGAVVRASPDAVWERTAELTLQGATSELDRVVRTLGGKIELQLGREVPTTPGRHNLDLRSIWRQQPVIEGSGVTVAGVVPEEVRVEVDELVKIQMPILVELPAGVQVQGTPQSEPVQVELVAPSTTINQLQSSGAVARAVVASEQIEQLFPGRTETVRGVEVGVDGLAAGAWETRLSPSRVNVRVLLRSLTETLELGPMPVQVLVAPDEVGRYVIEIAPADRDVVGVSVVGPGEAIEQIRSGSVVPTAYLALSLDQLESRVTSAAIRVSGLPPGVRVSGAERTVQLTIRPAQITGRGEEPVGP